MGYRIDYQPTDQKIVLYRGKRTGFLTGICFLLFVLLTNFLWPEGTEEIRRSLYTASGQSAIAAAEVFAEEFGSEKQLKYVFSDFWKNMELVLKIDSD